MAARAALAKGDRFRAVRLIREAYARAHPDFMPAWEAQGLWDAADDEMRALLAAAGVPRAMAS